MENDLYVKNTLNKVSNMSREAKTAYLVGNLDEALNLVKAMKTKLEFVKAEIEQQIKVKA